MKSNWKKRMLAVVLCMVIALSNSSFIFASSGTEEPAAVAQEGDPQNVQEAQTEAAVQDTPAVLSETTPEATPEATPEPTQVPEVTAAPTEAPQATAEPTQAPEVTEAPEATPVPTEAPVTYNEAVELKHEFKDENGNVTATVTAQIPAGAFQADASELTMEVTVPDQAATEHVKKLMEESLPEHYMLGDTVLYDIRFKVNGTETESQQPIVITFENQNGITVKDVKKAVVFQLDPEDPAVEGDKDELVTITQRNDMIESLQNSGQSTDNVDDYDLSEITLKEDGTSNKIQMEGRTSTIYGCYAYYEPVQVLTYEDDQVTVTVSAAENGVIPANAELKVVPITEDKETEDQYKDVEKKLQEKAEEEEYEIAGFLAYDITFVDPDGNETEPNGEVKVSIDYNEAAIPESVSEEDAQNAEVSVMHLEEDEDGNVAQVVDMNEAGQLDVVETDDSQQVQKIEMWTESFSTYTIYWYYYGTRFNITLHYMYLDESGTPQEIPGNAEYNYFYNTSCNLSEYVKEISGYQYQNIIRVDNSENGTEITQLKVGGNRIQYLKKGSSQYVYWLRNGKSGDIYYIYKKIGVEIQDNLIEKGTLDAVYNGELKVLEYKWYRSDSEDGDYELVKKIDYQGNVSNLSENGTSLYPSYDNGAQKYYKVEVIFEDGSSEKSSAYQVPYYDELKNGSFETPVVTGTGSNRQWSNAEYKNLGGVWQTTGLGSAVEKNNQDIEIVREGTLTGKSDYNWSGDWNNAAPEGKQFAELNCETAGALYQDVLTIPGQPLNYSLDHRARGTSQWSVECDTMFLVIMPTKDSKDLITQEQLESKLKDLGVDVEKYDSDEADTILYKDNGILVVRITSNDQNWHEVTKIAGYTPTESVTRFFFVAGSTAATRQNVERGNTIGNFLDDVWFSQKLPDVKPNQFTLQIKKEVEGLGNEEFQELKNNIKFKLLVTKNDKLLSDTEVEKLFGVSEITGDMMDETTGGNILSYNKIVNMPIESGVTYKVTITEEGADLTNYTRTSSSQVTVNDVEQDETEGVVATLDIASETKAVVEFTNSYESTNYKNVNFTKIWDDNNNAFETRPESLDVTLHGTVTYVQNGTSVSRELTGEELGVEVNRTLTGSDWSTSWKVPVYYEITHEDGTSAKIKIQYTVTEGTVDSDYVYESGTLQQGDGKEYEYSDFADVTITGDGSATTVPAAKSTLRTAKASVAAYSDNTESSLGEPSHRKYITYNEATGDYTLNLDVTGKKGEAEGVDVLFVIDTSGSMANNRLLVNVKNLLTKDGGIIDQILSGNDNVNSVAYVSFAGKSETKTSSWYGKNSSSTLKNRINSLRATGGTNWTYAMMKAEDMLDARSNSGNEKVMIFLSDGEPTYSIKSNGSQYGYGNYTVNQYYTEAIEVVTKSASLSAAQKYSVYLTDNTAAGMEKFADGTGAELKNGINLSGALSEILNKIIPTYENVSITDTLSKYVEFSEGANPTVTVTKDGVPLETSKYRLTTDTDSVTVSFKEELEDGATYTVSFRVKPTQTANEEYSTSGYPDRGDSDTGVTSAGQEGFYSNDDAETKLTYSIKGTEEQNLTAKYPKPVVQVTTHDLTFEKTWNNPDNVTPPEQVILDVVYSDGTTEAVTLTKDKGWTVTKSNVPVTKKVQSVTERAVADYTPSYEISEDGTKVTVTNSYSKITTTNITVKKIWSGNGPKSDVKVSLYYSENGKDAEQLYKTVTLNKDNDWTYTWEDLNESDWAAGKDYTYAVREEKIPENYTSNITYSTKGDTTTATINNVYDPNCADEKFYIVNVLQTIPLTVTKTWDDNNDIQGERPESLGVTVQEGNHTLQFTLSNNNNWMRNVVIPERKDKTYTATEYIENIENYKQVDDSVSVTDQAVYVSFTNQIETTSVTVQKQWIDGDAAKRPGSISFALYRNNDLYEIYTLSKEDLDIDGNAWTKVIEGLPVTGSYEVKELSLTNEDGKTYDYTSEVTMSEDGKMFTITNKLNWHIFKTSRSLAGEETVNLEGAKFDLKQNDTIIAKGTSDFEGKIDWKVESDSVSLNDLNGDYQLVETRAPSGYVLHAEGWTLTFANGLLESVKDNKTSAIVKASFDAEKGATVTVTNDKVYELPSTGGSGIFWYMISGTAFLMAASLILYRMKRKEVLGK